MFNLKVIKLVLMGSLLFTSCVSNWGTKNVYKGNLSSDQLNEIALLIEETEMDPTSSRADELRQTLSLWLVKSPDISVRVYDILDLSDEYKYKQLFTTQAILLSAKYIIRNPKMEKEHLTIQLQTTDGLLGIYDRIVSSEGEPAKSPNMESIKNKRRDGELEIYVQSIIAQSGD